MSEDIQIYLRGKSIDIRSGYVNALLKANVSPDAEPTFRDFAPAVIQAAARFGFAPLTLQLAADPLEQRARELGIVNSYNGRGPARLPPRTNEACTAPLPGASLPGASYPSQPRTCRRETRFENLARV